MTKHCRLAIVGGGLAGLAAANGLKRVGIEATVFEAAPQLGEIGAAVNCSPQAVKALNAIGVGEAVAAVGHMSPGPYTRNLQTGEFLQFRDRLAMVEKYGAPYYSFHRADLIDALASGLDGVDIRLGHRLSAIDEQPDGTILSFDNGETITADYLIGADGVRSVIRKALYGDDHPTYTGQTSYRALLKADDVPAEALAPHGHVLWVGPGRHLIAYYIRGGKSVNVVSQIDTDEWTEEGWAIKGDPDEMRRSFADAEPRLMTLLAAIRDCSKWGLFARKITPNWGRNRIQLIGDAAHAMLPSAGQGACQAFEDSYILGRWLAACDDPVEAFEQFRRIRIPRVQGVQRLSNANKGFRHMKDAGAMKKAIDSGKGSVFGSSDWVLSFDPVSEWDQEPVVPAAYMQDA